MYGTSIGIQPILDQKLRMKIFFTPIHQLIYTALFYFRNLNSNPLLLLIFFCSCNKPNNKASAVGGHPGT